MCIGGGVLENERGYGGRRGEVKDESNPDALCNQDEVMGLLFFPHRR